MHLRQLETFVVVAEQLHFGRAAEVLHLSQPALSRQVSQLERELGVRLLRRTRRRVELTAAGAAYLAELRQAMHQLDRAARTAQGVSAGELGALRIGHVDSAAYRLLPRALRRFRADRPGIGIALVETGGPAVRDGLLASRFDIALVREAPGGDGIDEALLLEEPFVAALPDGHPGTGSPTIELSSMAEDPFVTVARRNDPVLHDRVLELCRRAGFAPSIAYEAAPLASTLPIVGAGLASAVVPLGLAQHTSIPGVVYRPLQDTSATLELHAAWRHDDDSPLVAEFIATLREVAKEGI